MMNSVQVMVEHQVPGQFETKELDVCVFPPRSFDIRFMWQIRKQKNKFPINSYTEINVAAPSFSRID